MDTRINVAHDIFTGLNDSQGILICGYEWGGDPDESTDDSICETREDVKIVFSNKVPRFGEVANTWPYDRNIMRWFGIWGHPLRRDGIGGDFEKTILQTNWCDTQARKMDSTNRLLDADQVKNFIFHIETFKPRLILFCGSAMAYALNNPIVLQPFQHAMGEICEPLLFPKKEFSGRKFRIGFQSFKNCDVVFLPHPSGSRGLRDDYLAMFTSEIGSRIAKVKQHKNIPL